ncbi:aminotransferase class I/II-fold pyridoxal phosphate-dependent enzyme [Flavivirga aquimarina]|uniref:Aminotransferase class I/II-fold pyridoxal phosphate-dependent enzyme n=1 Tax=Flavivirga aquimarina TaxID=2027862 RepID=A0ABT8W5G4_9FLAO|nr:aminotransferase class I/II-fold pyridoxal phosphate-dependent enzyme [Flavivirga aquimarina]MDO5968354.1 aminotransferase class I/II-fold pyridoxal phosphate-dependent enzyme [Flavivirga aquimarina]
MKLEKILITGAKGQLGSVLTQKLQEKWGVNNVISSDLRLNTEFNGNYKKLDVTDFDALKDIVTKLTNLRDKLEANTNFFRSKMASVGFNINKGTPPIVPIMLGDPKIAQEFVKRLLEEGIYVIGFFFPVVPKGKARIRVQLSAKHSKKQIENAINAFVKVGKELKIIG